MWGSSIDVRNHKAPRRVETKRPTIRPLEGHLILDQTIFAELEQQGKMAKK
jgi:hypothetical protein